MSGAAPSLQGLTLDEDANTPSASASQPVDTAQDGNGNAHGHISNTVHVKGKPKAGGGGRGIGGRQEDSPDTQLSKALSYILRHGAASEGLKVLPDGYVELEKVLTRPKISKIKMPPRSKERLGNGGGGGDDEELEARDATPAQAAGGREAVQASSRAPDVQDVLECVDSNVKKRFQVRQDAEMNGGKWWIRAVQGHSMKDVVDLDHVPLTLSNLAEHLSASSSSNSLETPSTTHPTYTLVHGTTPIAFTQILATGGLLSMSRNHIHLAKGIPGAEGVISGMRTSSKVRIFVNVEKALKDGVQFGVASNGAVLTPGVPYTPPSPPSSNTAEGRSGAHAGAAAPSSPASTAAAVEQALAPTPNAAPSDTPNQRKYPPRKPRPPQASKSRAKAASALSSSGLLPLKYFARVEDDKGGILCLPHSFSSDEGRAE
ncbi:hypothetical protein K437DRAFT_259221 [Tilletiaria anomala UBC 951]|uniref:2'-phosphotransferase n=1 Tax=Tilletiaria anomala (strain ATCC 24038 / CBS 436.72 / UBC 951) TaxID=1037660 RepID=A0A066VJU1_TILAU|nr:uncharacterized protein K437DRAFT_259221 [Tilletiaria anomala UBC 951]KDN39019.1 hypothetical protein K437DRAFT_259221 [Tilletiaria anomala UBC 951]